MAQLQLSCRRGGRPHLRAGAGAAPGAIDEPVVAPHVDHDTALDAGESAVDGMDDAAVVGSVERLGSAPAQRLVVDLDMIARHACVTLPEVYPFPDQRRGARRP
jgi:hypothetical protein